MLVTLGARHAPAAVREMKKALKEAKLTKKKSNEGVYANQLNESAWWFCQRNASLMQRQTRELLFLYRHILFAVRQVSPIQVRELSTFKSLPKNSLFFF